MTTLGRPTEYNEDIADKICESLADGLSLRQICSDVSMPSRATVFRWLAKYEDFRDQYARARDEQAETLSDDLVAISDEKETIIKDGDGQTIVAFDATAVARNRLRIEARKWVASKLKPKKYGDKLELSGNKEAPLTVNILRLSEQD